MSATIPPRVQSVTAARNGLTLGLREHTALTVRKVILSAVLTKR